MMRKTILLCMMLSAVIFGFMSCNDKNDEFDDVGTSSILSFTGPEKAYMGDSIDFSFELTSSGPRPNQAKVQVYYGEQLVSERFLLTDQPGAYSGKVAFPFLKDIPDGGEVDVVLRTQNERFASDTRTHTVVVNRPQFPYLTLVTSEGEEYRMDPVPGKPFEYAVEDTNLPIDLQAYIVAPKYGENGKELTFGNVDGSVALNVTDFIRFELNTATYRVEFNTETYKADPAVMFAMNGLEFTKVTDTEYRIEGEFTKGQEITVTGLITLNKNWTDFWIDPSWFNIKQGSEGRVLVFRGTTGKYRFTCDTNRNYLYMEVMNGTALATTNSDGTGGVWCIGDGNIGKPSYQKNNINWTPNKGFCLCPVEPNVHEVILRKGTTINTINFKFFAQKNWGVEFTASKYKSPAVSVGGQFLQVNASDGNLKAGSTVLAAGKYYKIRLTVTEGMMGQIEVTELDEIAEVE